MDTNTTLFRALRNAGLTILALAAILGLSTCKAPFGLGGQVDIGAPTIEIDAPARDSYHNGDFLVTGTVADDLSVDSVTVLVLTKSGTVLGSFPAVVAGTSFSVTIPAGSDPALEGYVVLEAVVRDASKKITKTSTSVSIDKKAPTVLVTSPLTQAPDSPVQTDYIDIKGEVFDHSPIASVRVNLVDAAGDPITGDPATSTQLADGTNTWTTRFLLKGAIAGLLDGSYFYNVRVTDDAGNTNSYYFHRTDIIAVKDPGATFPSMDEIGRLDQDGAAGVSGITALELQGKRIALLADYSDFVYQSDPQIVFDYSSINTTGTVDENTLAPKSKITGAIIPPTGGGAIARESVVARIYNYSTSALVTTISNTAVDDETDNIKVTTVGSAANFSITLKDGAADLAPGKYTIRITASNDTYSITKTSNPSAFTIDAETPVFEETEVEVTELFWNAQFQFNFNGSHSTELADIQIEQSFNGSPFSVVQTIPLGTLSITNQKSANMPSGGLGDGLYNYRITLTTVGGKSTYLLRSITYDTTDPILSVSNVTPVVGTNSLNGNVNITVSAADANGLKGVRLWLLPTATAAPTWDSGSLSPGYYHEWTTPPYTTGNINTLALGFSGAAKLYVITRDKADNEFVLPAADYTIDQATDMPSFSLSNMNVLYDTLPEAYGNLQETGAKVSGSVIDDDGINGATLRISVDGAASVLVGNKTGNGSGFNFWHDLSALPEGTHYLTLTVNDVNGLAAAPVTVYFTVDKASPTVTISSPANGALKNADFQIAGSAVDAMGILSVAATRTKDGVPASTTAVTVTVTPLNATTKTWTIDQTGLTDGSYLYEITALDNLNKPTTASLTVVYDQTAPVVSIATPIAASWNRGTTMTATGTAPGSSLVQWSTNNVDWSNASGTDSWAATVTIAALAEGSGRTLYIKATDLAGNVGTQTRAFGIDQADPTSSVSGPASASALFALSGTAADSNAVKSVVITQMKDGDPGSLVTAYSDLTLSGTSDGWATGSILPDGGVATGTYDYTITITDVANNASVYNHTVKIDLAPPSSAIINPAGGDLLFGTNYTARGTASDTGPSLLNRVEYSTNSTNGVNGTWASASGTDTWSVNLDLVAMGQGTRTLWIRAVDNAGNVEASPESVSFMIDQSNPTLTETTSTLTETLVYRAASVNFGGSSTDANGIASVVVSYEKDGVTTVGLNQTSGAATWAWTLNSALGDGLYLITIVATDGAARTSTITRKVNIDTSGPSLQINAPLAGQPATTQSFPISGNAYETGGSGFDGTDDIQYTLDNWTTTATLPLAAGAWGTTVDLGAAQGARTLIVRATDRLGNVTETPVNFFFDKDLPTVSETLVGTTDIQYVNNDKSFSVTAADTWMLHATEAVDLAVNGVHVAYLTLVTGAYPYTFPVDTDGLAGGDTTGYQDGEYVLTFTAKDAANKTRSVTRTVVVDTTIPTLSGITDLSSSWKGTESNSVSGASSDGSGSGVALVEYNLNSAGWNALSGTTAFSGILAIPSGADNLLQIRARDRAGNYSAVSSQLVDVDTTNPSISLLTPASVPYVSGLATLATTFTGIDSHSGVATVEIKVGSNDFASPDVSSAAPSAGTRANGTWSLTVPAASINAMAAGQRDVYVRVTDAVGKTTITSFPVIVDKTDPTAAFSLPVASSTVNRLITVSGTGSDTQSLASVAVSVQTGAASWSLLQTFTGSDGFNWSIAGVDTDSWDGYDADGGTSGVQIRFRAVATDSSGRAFTATRVATVDQDSDRPLIKLTNLATLDGTTTLKMSRTVFGTVGDDDGVTKFEIGESDFDGIALTAAGATDLFATVSGNHGLSVGTALYFSGADLPLGVSAGTRYYIIAEGFTATAFKIAATLGGARIDLLDDGSGPMSASAFTTIALDGGTWSYEATEGEGLKRLYFRVTDTTPVVFTTDLANEPRIQLGAGYLETYAQFRIDTVAPEFSATESVRVDRTSAFDFGDMVDMSSAMAFGGPNNQFALRILSKDANNIASVRVLVPGAAGSPYAAIANGSDPVQTTFTRFDTGTINVGAVPDGSVTVTIEVTDNSGLTAATTRTIIVDNTAPTLGFIAPSTGALIKADTTISGNASDGGSGLASVTYRVGLDYATDGDLAPSGETYLWEIPFSLADTSYQDVSESYLDTSTGTDIYILPFVVKVTDQAGNARETVPITGAGATRANDTTLSHASLATLPNTARVKAGQVIMVGTYAKVITSYTPATGTVTWTGAVPVGQTSFQIFEYALRVNPDGDKPTAQISYPLDGATLGGNIRIYGTAEDNQAVAEVWMQIDTNSDGAFTAADDAIGGWYNGGLGKKIDGASSWNYTINTGSEFNPAPGDTKKLDIRVQAKDINGKIGPWSLPITIYVDAQVPQIGSSAILVLDPDADPDNGNEIPYTYGMYIKGTWYLRGSIVDEGAIDRVTISGAINKSISWNGAAYTGDTSSFALKVVSGTAAPMYSRIDLNVLIACPADTSAAWNFNISALDNSDPSKETFQALRLNIDTKAPVAGLIAPTTSSTLVQQSDGWYKIKGQATDDGSDISRVEVFFVRRGASAAQDRIYNPLKPTANMSYLSAITLDAAGSPVLTGTATRPSVTSLTHAALANQPMINVGQKIMVGTELRTVNTYTAGTGTITWLDGDVVQTATSYTLRLAIQIDNKNVTERWIGATLDSDDGDGYLEYLKQSSGTTYTWFADIDSENIPDGPIEIHYIAYDFSGNATHGQTPLSSGPGHYTVQNNGPRIAAIELGTNLNGDSDASDPGETAQFNYASATDETETIAAAFTVKDGPMTLKPIVTNGNGDLYVWMTVSGSTYAVSNQLFRSGVTTTAISIPGTSFGTGLGQIDEGSRTFTIEVWDSTEELTPGTDSLKLTRGVTATIDVVDGNAPYAAVRPLYWNGAGDNSLYQNLPANGHVDITSNAGNGLADPDVSGKVSLRGVAYDDQRIESVWVYIGNGTNDTARFAFSGALDSKQIPAASGRTYAKVAAYSGGTWTYANNFAANGWQFTVISSAIGQEGHRISWQLDWNSAMLPNGAALDRSILVAVEDKAANDNATGATVVTLAGTGTRTNGLVLVDAALIGQGVVVGLPVILKAPGSEEAFFTRVASFDDGTGTIQLADFVDTGKTAYTLYKDAHNAPSYAMDVVPYITDISRKAPFTNRLSHLAGKEGWYPVFQGQTGIEISGFNLPYATGTTITGNGTVAVGATTFGTAAPDLTAALADRTKVTVTIPAALVSGAVVVTTNSVTSINNANSGTPAYNAETPFTDDRTIYIDDIDPTVYIAPFGRRYKSGVADPATTDPEKILKDVTDYNENIVMSGQVRLGHVEYAEHSRFSAISVVITPASDSFAAVGHGLAIGQMVSLNFVTTAPQLNPAVNVTAKDLFYVISDGFGANAFKVSQTPGGAAADFTLAGNLVTVVDPEVSGQVIFRGKAYDDQRIKRIAVSIEGFNGGNGSGVAFDVYTASTNASGVTTGTPGSGTGWSFAIDGSDYVLDSTRVITGHVLDWALSWDSSLIATTADTNVRFTVTVEDFNNTAHTASMLQEVDVVPYVSSIARTVNTNRSKLGKYPLRNGETDITVNGFNLFTSTAQNASNWIRIYSAATGGTLDADALIIEAAPAPTKTSFQMTMHADSNSGWFRLAVNGIEATNAINDNAQAYNKEISATNAANTANWTDDRYLMLFKTGDSFANSIDPEYISMTFDPVGLRLIGEWSNSGYAATYFGRPVADGNTRTELFATFDPPTWTDVYMDADGQMHSVILEDYNNGGTTWGFLASYINGGSRVSIESLGNDDPSTPVYTDGRDEKLHQFRNARIAVRSATNDQYVSYYDYYSKTLKYGRMLAGANTMTSETTHRTDQLTVVDGIDNFGDTLAVTGVNASDWFTTAQSHGFIANTPVVFAATTIPAGLTAGVTYYVSATNLTATRFSVSATEGGAVINFTSNGTAVTVTTTADADVGMWSDIQIDDKGAGDTATWRPVIVYYDNTNEKLKLARGNSSQPSGTAGWTIQDVTGGEYMGSGSLSMKIDTSGNLHIVTRNGMEGGLYYIYAANINGTGTYTFSTPVCIDPQTADGSWADITLNGTSPMVSYKNGTSYNGLKYAYVASGSGLSADDWEYMVVPSATAVADQRTNIEYTATATDFPYDGHVAFGYAASNFQIVYLRRQLP